ncbi:PadR family transcriptional regulator [Actinokineospora bangkokensis]|uniref:PadR family transcriptional regulator n=1 Tax=Actinokineospora bangkokensis TaxID=1193682 RepID=A0A1Q9LE40_9PSEU|nr:PadR family transcriptional regulator [Actinokineospora bangkokensis]
MKDFRNGALRLRVLHLATSGEPHGAVFTEHLASAGHKVSPGTLYPLLHRLQEAGLLKSRSEVVEGKRVVRYRTTKRGRKSLADCRAVLTELADDVAD